MGISSVVSSESKLKLSYPHLADRSPTLYPNRSSRFNIPRSIDIRNLFSQVPPFYPRRINRFLSPAPFYSLTFIFFPIRPAQMAILRMYTKSDIDDQMMLGVLQNSNLLDTAFIIVPIKGWAQGPLGDNSPIRYMLEMECLL